MGRFREQADTGDDAGIDMSPLIDCVFILLIFFIVTTVFVEEPGVEIEKASAMTAEQLEKSSILFAVTPEGGVVYGGREVGLSRVRPIVERFLQKEQIPVIIQVDRNSDAAIAIRVVAEARLANAETVSFSTEMGDA